MGALLRLLPVAVYVREETPKVKSELVVLTSTLNVQVTGAFEYTYALQIGYNTHSSISGSNPHIVVSVEAVEVLPVQNFLSFDLRRRWELRS